MGDMADWLTDQADIPDEDGNAPCRVCYGSGKCNRRKCSHCGGSGYDPGDEVDVQPKGESGGK